MFIVRRALFLLAPLLLLQPVQGVDSPPLVKQEHAEIASGSSSSTSVPLGSELGSEPRRAAPEAAAPLVEQVQGPTACPCAAEDGNSSWFSWRPLNFWRRSRSTDRERPLLEEEGATGVRASLVSEERREKLRRCKKATTKCLRKTGEAACLCCCYTTSCIAMTAGLGVCCLFLVAVGSAGKRNKRLHT